MNVSEQWEALCSECDQAKQEFYSAWSVVMPKFRAIGEGRSRENPTNEELERLESATRRRDAAEDAARAFMKAHL